MSNLTLVRNKLNLSMKYWFNEAKIVFCICHVPEKVSKYHQETVQTTSSKKITITGQYLKNLLFSMAENASFQG